MPSLMDLLPEILEEIVLELEVEDVISLGSSCTDLARIVSQERLWRIILAKTELVDEDEVVMEDRVLEINTFLRTLANADAILSLLREMIYERHSATGEGWDENITVSFPSSLQLHVVSGIGLELLALTDRDDSRHTLHKVNVWTVSPCLLLALASLKREEITELEVEDLSCTTEEEGRALVSLLESSITWRVEVLELSDEVGGMTWQGLATVGREGSRGRLGNVRTGRQVVRRGRREDVMAVWEKTEDDWLVDGDRERKSDWRCWIYMEAMIQ